MKQEDTKREKGEGHVWFARVRKIPHTTRKEKKNNKHWKENNKEDQNNISNHKKT